MFAIADYWWPYLYQYGVGLIVFVIGMYLILHYKSCDLSLKRDRFWFGVLILGFVWYASIHLCWYLVAIYVMSQGGNG